MAPRRGAHTKVINTVNYNNLSVNEVLCPICRSILIEPVSLPCSHDFCSACFQGTIENANLVCPLCRLRIGSWLRSSTKAKTLVNQDYWNAIKKTFPVQIRNKLGGIDENLETDVPVIKIADPGEIRKEYEVERQKEELVLQKERQAEQKASEELIQKIKQEEELQKRLLDEKLKFDEEMARKIAAELKLQKPDRPEPKKPQKCGPLDKFLTSKSTLAKNELPSSSTVKQVDFNKKEYTCRILCQDINSGGLGLNKKIDKVKKMHSELNSDSSDSIESEYRYFKPVDYRNNPPTKGISPVKVTPKRIGRENRARISAPEGANNFKINMCNTAFACVTPTKNVIEPETVIENIQKQRGRPKNCKRKLPLEETITKKTKQDNNNSINGVKKINSPPFRGFDNAKNCSQEKSQTFNAIFETIIEKSIVSNNNNVTCGKNLRSEAKYSGKDQKLLQEKADFELAKKLHAELNNSQNTRSRNISNRPNNIRRTRKRQATLHDMLTPSKVK